LISTDGAAVDCARRADTHKADAANGIASCMAGIIIASPEESVGLSRDSIGWIRIL